MFIFPFFFLFSFQVALLYPEAGHVEIDPDELWQSFISVVKGAVKGTATPHPVIGSDFLAKCGQKHTLVCGYTFVSTLMPLSLQTHYI